ncbi:hypothetical protein N7508_000778 [Penicillium antarcticum]|uniref:uncharacterized protein n=1 Tax=Penicillium antarcticum TaxID=416450 RepID=UPI00238A4D42|nr:uncharacterized protein N7508_000778 [Penicillium antarcticum]KAJ5320495.1 hypothetical protein N7508_000778 [Penicillium antarcticum]
MYRFEDVSAGFHTFPHASLIGYKMKAMIQYRSHRSYVSCCKIHPYLVNHQPFVDGNGRMCRLILNAMLLKLGSCLICLGKENPAA